MKRGVSADTRRMVLELRRRHSLREVAEQDWLTKNQPGNLFAALHRVSMVGAAGFEPATICPQGRCATRLRYAPTGPILYQLMSKR